MDRHYLVSLFRRLTDTDASRATLAWPDLCEALSSPVVCASKTNAPGWSPATYLDDERGPAVEAVACLVFDVDGALPELSSEVAWIAHTTHSHTPESPRWRVVVATDRPHTPGEHRALWETVARALGLTPDTQTVDAGRFYWGPSTRTPEGFQVRRGGTRPIPVDGALGAKIAESPRSETVPSPQPETVPASSSLVSTPLETPGEGGLEKPENFEVPGPIDLEPLRARVKQLKNPKTRAALNALLNFGALPTKGGRNAWMHAAFAAVGAMGWGADVANLLAEQFANRVELDTGETREEWKRLALFSYRRSFEQREHRDALTTSFVSALKGSPPEDWRHRLLTITKGDTVRVDANGHNVQLILTHDEAFKSLRWNTLTCDVEIPEGPFAAAPRGTLDVAVTDWLYATPEYRLKMSREEVVVRLLAVARSKIFDPVRNYLEELKWDGVERLNSLLEVYCGVTYGRSDYARTIGRRFMVGAVARAYRPGCQMDTVLLLKGPQGVGKTSFVRSLGGPFMAELHMDPSNKDTLQAISGRWFVELSELASARKSDAETMRAFITRRVDVLRVPYGRVTEEFPRRCVFVGTTNDDDPLTDQHGNRRYWPVTVSKVDTFGLERDRDQLFAEAVHAFKAGERWWLDEAEQHVANEEIGLFTSVDIWADMVREWFGRLTPEQRPAQVSIGAVAMKALRLEPGQISKAVAIRIGFVLKSLRFVRIGVKSGKEAVMYQTPKEFLEEVRP